MLAYAHMKQTFKAYLEEFLFNYAIVMLQLVVMLQLEEFLFHTAGGLLQRSATPPCARLLRASLLLSFLQQPLEPIHRGRPFCTVPVRHCLRARYFCRKVRFVLTFARPRSKLRGFLTVSGNSVQITLGPCMVATFLAFFLLFGH